MKTRACFLVSSVLALAVPAGAQIGPGPEEFSQLKIIQTEAPVYPLALNNSWVVRGDATVTIDIDQNGRLTDCLVTGYSRKEFGDSAVAALRQWQFEPPRLRGKPWAAVQELHFDYTRTGVVVNMTGYEALTNRLDELLKSRLVYRTYSLRELDRIPTPVQVVSPLVPSLQGGDRAKHSVTVEFYIDEGGRVRLPSVTREAAGTVHAASALAAVRRWRFEPPLFHGHPVLTLVRQEFNFAGEK